jgi:poly(3-hydroxyoctanoate) depolymerase
MQQEERLVVAGDTAIRVWLVGQGPDLLLLNGLGGHVGMWQPLVEELGRSRRLVMFDAPGTGATAPLRRPLRMSRLVALVTGILDELELGRVDLLGYSWGGALAQQVAVDAHHRVRRLVLAATVPGAGGWPPSMRVVTAMLSPRRFSTPQRSREAAALLYGGDYRRGTAGPRSALRRWNEQPPSPAGYAQQLYAITGWTSLPWLHRVRASTLILTGDDDPLVPLVNARLMAGLLPRAELHVVQGAGHLWLLDHAADSAAVIEAFLSG